MPPIVLPPVMAVLVEVLKDAVPVGLVPVDQFDPVVKTAVPGLASQVAFWARAGIEPTSGDRHVPASNTAASRLPRRARKRPGAAAQSPCFIETHPVDNARRFIGRRWCRPR